MLELKIRLYNKEENEIFYIDNVFIQKDDRVRLLDDFPDYVRPMIFTGRVDNGGAELWEGDKLTNRFVFGEIVYSEDHAAFMMKYLHREEENIISIKKALELGFYRIGNVYCNEH